MNRRELLKGIVAAPVVAMLPVRPPIVMGKIVELPIANGGTGANVAAIYKELYEYTRIPQSVLWSSVNDPLSFAAECAPTDTASVFRLPSPFPKSLPPFSLRKSLLS